MTNGTKPGAHTSIAAALVAAQAEMEPARKQSNNPHFKAKYADLAAVMDACMEALHKHGIAVIQPAGRDEHGPYVETVLLHTSGERLDCKVPLIFSKNDMQGYGSAMTYARRYGLMAMAGVAPEDDDGEGAKGTGNANTGKRGQGNAGGPNPPPNTPGIDPDKPAAATIAAAREMLEGAISEDDLKAKWRMLPPAVKTAPGIEAAAKARKAQLAAQQHQPGEPIFDDQIPF